MPRRSAILKQIEEDDGVPGSRVRKNAQRASDANPIKATKPQPAAAVSRSYKRSSKSKE